MREFDASTCSGKNGYDIFENEDEIITNDSIVWVNTNRKIWEVRITKITYSDLPQDSNIKNWCGLIQRRKTGFWLKVVPENTNRKKSYISSEI